MNKLVLLGSAAILVFPLASFAQSSSNGMMSPPPPGVGGPAPAGMNPSVPERGATVGPTGRINESGPQQNDPDYDEEQGMMPPERGETVDPTGAVDESGPVQNGEASPYHDHE